MEKYKVSIIVPVYNAERYLRRCVASLVNQNYSNLEIILVNDGSTDGSGPLCDELTRNDFRMKTVHKKNGGLISAWKKGVENSTGEYLCFVDSDDWVDTDMVSGMAAFLTGSDQEIISSDYVIERDNGKSQFIWQKLQPGVYEGKNWEKVIPKLLGEENRYVCMSRCMKLISRRLIVENSKFCDPVIRTGEDTMIMFPSLIDCKRFVAMDRRAYYHYLYVQESMIHQYDRGLFENIQLLKEIIDQIIDDKFSGAQREEMRKGAQREYILLLLLVLKNEARGNPKGYRRNILKICRQDEIQKEVKSVKIEVAEKANQLLYLVLRHPDHVTVSALRLAMIVFYGYRRRHGSTH